MPTVLLVDDDPALPVLVGVLVRGSDIELRSVASGSEARRVLARARPDLVLVDLGLPDVDGVELIQTIVATWPGLPILVLTVATSEARILAALRAGASGYLFKEDLGGRLPGAIAEVLTGGAPLSPAAARAAVAALRAPSRDGLTGRERAVLDCLSRGLTYDDAGLALGISVNTVRTHVRRIYAKLEVSSKTEAALLGVGRRVP